MNSKPIRLTFLAACSALWLTAAVHAQTPTIVHAFGEFDIGATNQTMDPPYFQYANLDLPSVQYVDVTFSEAMNLAALNPYNYSIAGYTILDAKFFVNNQGVASPNMVILQLNNPLTGTNFTLYVSSNVQSVSGTPIAANTSVEGTLDPLSSVDIGVFSLRGTTFYEGSDTYLVNSSGQDIWNTLDGFRYIYTTRTNNFAVIVQVPYILPADPWSKAGLMVRETIDPDIGGSRMAALVATPATTQLSLDGDGGGENLISFQVRDTTGTTNGCPAACTTGEAYEPNNYVGDGTIATYYPNIWLLLTRLTTSSNDLFSAYSSTNEADWTWVGYWSPTTNGMETNFPAVVNVGMATSTDVYTTNNFLPDDNTLLVTAMYEHFGDYAVHVFLTNSPQSVTVGSGDSATFSVLAGSDCTFSSNGVTGPSADYQWYTNDAAVPGANASIYTIPLTTTSMSGMTVYCAISANSPPPLIATTNSATAILTVTNNTAPPTIVSAFGEYDSGTSNQFVDVTFDEAMNAASILNLANYTISTIPPISGLKITNVMFFTNNLGVGSTNQVVLQLNKPLTHNFTLTVLNVQSFSGIAILAADTTFAGTLDPMSSIDIGIFGTNGVTYYEGPGSYLVNSDGQDIGPNQDGFRFVYGTRTNNFAVAVQVPWIIPADAWSKAGLMAREKIDPSDGGSRMISVYTTPSATQLGLDGTYGENSISFQVRYTNDGPANEPAVPENYIGDGVIAPSYPNQWLLLTRQTDGTNDLFTAYASTNAVNWTWVGDFNPLDGGTDTPFPSVVNVGMCASTDIYPPVPYQMVTAMFENFGDYVGDEVSVISSPKSVTNESGTSATFSVVVNSASTVFYRGATNALATYQWYSVIGGVTNLIPGANGGTYTTPLLTTNLDGEKVYCAISAIGSATTIDSVAATLTVTENPTVPTIVSAFGQYDSNTSLQYVDITFSETMNMASILNTTNYSIADNTITAAMLFTNNLGVGEPTNVILELGTQLTGDFTLVVSNKVQSFSGIPIAADDTSIATTLDPLSSIDIPYTVAPTNGTTYYEGAGSYLVNASGSSIFWNDQDSFHYVYTTRTNNFNIVVQVPSIIPGHSWSVAGLMARETIDPNDGGSRMVAVVTTAAATQLALDGTYGANTLSMSARDTNDGAAFEPGGAYEPGAYIGDYVLAPSYPNQWLLLTRQTDATSDLFTAYASTNAVNWTWVGDFSPLDGGEDTNFPSVVWVGMCTSSDSDNNDLATATYQNFGDYVGHVFLTNSPTNVTVESGTSATFSVLVGSDTFTMNGVINMFPVTYQWYTNSVAVPGATADIYTTPLTTASLNGEQVYCAMTAMGATTATNSATATLTVTANPAVPTIVSAFAEYDSGTSDQYVDVTFSEVMNVASLLNSANYSITGYTITGVKLFTNDLGVGSTTMAILQLNKALTGGFTLNVNNVQSFSGIAIAANTSITTTADPLTSIDIGVFSLPGTTYYEGPGSYEVDASGQDIWNTLDGFRFVYTTRTNNFDVVVQVPFILPADAWSKAGLMARETIDPKTGGSRMIAVYTTAAASQLALDGTYGENTVSMAVRDTTGTTNETSDVGEAYQPADYIGDGIIAPSYPNQWLRLTRVTDGTTDLFTAYASTNKADWTWLGDFNPVTTGADKPFPSVVNVGMASSTDIYTPNNFLPDTNTLLVTAMYQNFGDYLAVPVPTLKATLVAVSNSVTISWTPTGGSLYSSPVLNGTNWALVTTNNPAAIPITKTDQSMFFKVGP